jgi:two-component system cell cycle response regulator
VGQFNADPSSTIFYGAQGVDKLKLLIVEDDDDQRGLIRETLEDYFGANTVRGVASSRAALELELTSFDLILTDYNLPDATGMELLREIRLRCSTPVIMVTGQNVGQIAAEAIRTGASDYVVKFGDYLFTIPLVVEKNLMMAKIVRENESLHTELEQALRDLRDKNSQLEGSLKKVEELAATDVLTGLYNRRHFNRVVEQLFAESERFDNDLSCVMIDLDGYKQLNDNFGHATGDQLLAVAGKVIQANMRKMDVAARYGGDEFVLLLPHASAEDAIRVARRIGEEFHQGSSLVLRRNEGVTMSLGIASRRCNNPSGHEQLMALADKALYEAKAAGKNRAVTCEPSIRK